MLRMTLQTRLVLSVLLDDPRRERYGLELCELLGLASGTIYPILSRLEQAGWLLSSWEDPTVHEESGRPRRRLYRLTDDGAVQAGRSLERTRKQLRLLRSAPSWEGRA